MPRDDLDVNRRAAAFPGLLRELVAARRAIGKIARTYARRPPATRHSNGGTSSSPAGRSERFERGAASSVPFPRREDMPVERVVSRVVKG